MRVLAGDCGGTNTRLGLFEIRETGLRMVETRRYVNSEAEGLEEIVADFQSRAGRQIETACIALAGPVQGRRARLTNLPWEVDANALEQTIGVERVVLLNDLEATAWAVTELPDESCRTLGAGSPSATGNGAVVAAGTGLGQAGLFWDGRRMRPFACEGGHTTFSPTDAVGDALLRRLRKRHQTVSWERVLSGSGLRELYLTLLEQRDQPEPEWFREAESQGGEAAAISRYGLDGTCGVCRQTLEIFARLYGEEAANLALKLMARGGVWIAGGIAPKILPVLEAGHFMDGFLRKGRMRSLLETVPVRVIVDELAPLRGAALRAAS